MRDVNEKYVRINMDFPNKAGKLLQVITTQKRLITKLSKTKVSQEVKELLISVAEGYDVAIDLMDWMKLMLQGVADDSEALLEGGRIRNSHRMQSEEILRLWAKLENYGTDGTNKGTVKN